jgi:hypothetical protein
MPSPSISVGIRRALAGAVLVGLLATGCTQGATGSPSASASPAGSGATGACATTSAPGDLGAWAPAATIPPVVPVIASSQQVCGENRILIGLLDAQNRPIGEPDRTLEVAFYNLGRDPNTPVSTADGQFVWAIEGERGLYVTHATFPEAGLWGAEVTTTAPGAQPDVVRLTFEVRPTGITAAVGQEAPASKTPALADVGGDVSKISTDEHPEPKLYQTSVDQALAAGKPFALIFATPKFCTSAVCGPTLDSVKPFIAEYPSVTFINVEPYQLEQKEGQLQPVLDAQGQLQPVTSVNEWKLTSEPWIFVVDKNGIIRASFEGVAGADEMRAALDSVK